MRVQMQKRGFTLIELLVVIAIIGLLAAILFPVFSNAVKKAKQTQCLNNVKQMALAYTMFVQDNREIGPDAQTWAQELESYVGNRKMYTCPLDTNGEGSVSYAYNGALVDMAGNGLNASVVTNPSEVGLFTDATSRKFPGGAVLNWVGDPTAQPEFRHSYCLSYADGHAEAVGGKKNVDADSIYSPIGRAFFQAPGYGWVVNPTAGVFAPTNLGDSSFQLNIAGSTTVEPIWKAAIAGWEHAGGVTPTIDLKGSSAWNQANAYGAPHMGGSSSTKTTISTDSTIIATDALGVIIPTTSTLNIKSMTQGDMLKMMNGTLFNKPYTVYTRDAVSGTREYWTKFYNGTGDNANGSFTSGTDDATIMGYDAASSNMTLVFVASAQEMIEKVAQDPTGIGYCGLGEADPTKVMVVPFKTKAGVVQKYDRPAVAKGLTAADGWGIQRPIYAINVTTDPAATAMFNYLKSDTFRNSLIFKSEFFAPKTSMSAYTVL